MPMCFIGAFDDEIRRISCWEKTAAYRKERELQSTNLKSLAYDPQAEKLKVTFHDSGTYEYAKVPSSVPRKIIRAKSAGKAFHRLVRGQFKYEKIGAVTTALQPHQQRVVDKIKLPDQPGLVVAHGLGSGKSLTSIAAQEGLGLDADVVVPAALRSNYAKEVAKHTSASKAARNIQSMQGMALRREPPSQPLMIVDEAHRIREMGTKANQVIRGNTAQKRLLLTATPFYNHPADIAPLINVAAGQNVMPGDRDEFSKRYIHERKVKPSFWGRLRGVAPGSVEELNPKKRAEVAGHFGKWVDYHATKKDDPNFPEVERADIKVPMSHKQLKFYDTALNKAPFWVSWKIKKGLPPNKQESKQLNAFMTAARQISNTTAAYQTKGTAEDPKIGAAFSNLKSNLEASPTSKAVVYSNYLGSGLEPYKKRLTAAGIPFAEFTGGMTKADRDEVMRRYNKGEVRTLLISSAGGEGLDLKGTRLVQVLDPHWNQSKIDQVEGRAIRHGSHAHLPPAERKVRVERYMATRPRSGMMERLHLRKPGQAADEYMDMLSRNKEQLIGSFRKVLEEQDMPKTAFVHGFADELEKLAAKDAGGDAEKLRSAQVLATSLGANAVDNILMKTLIPSLGYTSAPVLVAMLRRSSNRRQQQSKTASLLTKQAMQRTTWNAVERPSKARSLRNPPSLSMGPVRDEFWPDPSDLDVDPREVQTTGASAPVSTQARAQQPAVKKVFNITISNPKGGMFKFGSAKAGWQDKLPGGLADSKKPSDFPPKALKQGLQVESEHTSNPQMAKEIAMDHLAEKHDYYKRLRAVEKK